MLSHRIICVGRKAKDPLLEAAEDYLERLRHYARAELVLIRDNDIGEQTTTMLARLDANDYVIALDERGVLPSSMELAKKVENWQRSGQTRLAWLIGGANGLQLPVLARAHEKLSLSRMTLPHRLAKVVLLEQLYRAHTILRGERYHCGH